MHFYGLLSQSSGRNIDFRTAEKINKERFPGAVHYLRQTEIQKYILKLQQKQMKKTETTQ